jgi:branched-chain amino acid transport system ATP-binding protein
MSDVILEAIGVSKSFGGLRAVDGVNISVRRGSIHAVIGPNGAGKTTFFNTLSGYFIPDAGTVRFLGSDITREANWRRIARGMSRTFQTPSLFNELTVYQNLLICVQAQLGLSFRLNPPSLQQQDLIDSRIEELLGFIHLRHAKSRIVGELAHGSQRLVEIGMSLATDPQLVLLDEPMAGLAQAETDRISDVIRDLHERRGLTVLYVEHNMRVVLSLSHHVTVLNRGRLLADGTPAEIAASAAVREAYLGSEVVERV